MSDFNPNSTDAVLSRIETTLNAHVDETRLYRMSNDAAHGAVLSRVAELEGDKKKILGIAIGAGIGAGGIGAAIGQLFGKH